MSYQVMKLDKFTKKWVQAWGFKARSFIKANNDVDAKKAFRTDTKRCKQNLVLVTFSGFGYGTSAIIIDEINPTIDKEELAEKLFCGMHPKLWEKVKERCYLYSKTEGLTITSPEIEQKLKAHFYCDELIELIGE